MKQHDRQDGTMCRRTISGVAICILAIANGSFVAKAKADDAEWGTIIADFVDNEVTPLTRRYAKADLEKRWAHLTTAAAVDALGRIGEARRQMQVRSVPTVDAPMAVSGALSTLRSLDAILVQTVRDRVRVVEAEENLLRLGDICENSAVTANDTIRKVGETAFASAAMPDRPPILIAWDPTWISTIITLSLTAIMHAIDGDQRNKASEALARLPEKIVPQAEIIELSKASCKAAVTASAPMLDDQRKIIKDVRSELEAYEDGLWGTIRAIEQDLGAAAFQDVLEKSGIWEAELERSRDIADAELRLNLAYARNEMAHLRDRATQADGCSDGIGAVEAYEDALVELDAQVGVLLARPQPTRSQAKLEQTASEMVAWRSAVPGLYATARNRPCS